MLLVYAVLMFIIFSIPSALVFSPLTYRFLTLAHFFTFLLSVIVFVLLGRSLAKRHRPMVLPAIAAGFFTAFAAALLNQYLMRLPSPQQAFISQLHGVPPQAAITMLHLHMVTSALLISAMGGFFYATLGLFAAWWGGRIVRTSPDDVKSKEDPST
ncbi:MAG: hypothetical protein ACYCT0_01395 [Sulfobacillus sp.]